jgi:hypothetical protein
MSLRTEEFMRRFLLHVLTSGFHRIRHYGLLANANRKHDIATARVLLHRPAPELPADDLLPKAGGERIPGYGEPRVFSNLLISICVCVGSSPTLSAT